ncbi:uncharacterized protein LOC6570084 [Drosophila grimshawi]|uniref:GH25121 n=1 Tax=Drosophila grimshawi TaxID=7222 RepID=B4JZE1_DROGR|nr:uncharacterized protein LOC6570084 [Drosophila grimshawi]EDV94063.1 GH25121 [Drosophila grimshawi]
MANKTSTPIKDFSVFAQNCKIPRVDSFSAEVMRIFKPPKYKQCADQPALVTVQYNQQKKKYIVFFNQSLPTNLLQNISDYGCVYYDIVRLRNNSLTWNRKPVNFQQAWIVPRHIEGIVVECHELCNKSRVIQRDAFSFVQYPAGRSEKSDEERSRTHPSVIMLGIDSMSQMNFQRTMPLTAQFVRQLGWFEMLGYNKNSESTFSNLFILLTGSTWQQTCGHKTPGCLDAITYLWNHFHNAGYLTAYAEDTSTFGFSRQPVDYYLHPIVDVIEQVMGSVISSAVDYCTGSRQLFRYVFDYGLQLVQRFVKDTTKPIFGLFWTSSFSHDDFRGAANVDKEFVNYLEQYKQLGLFERAVVILFSDEGQRQGPLMKLKSSFMEERLPMLHIYLPPWYRQQHPEVVQALEVNRRRLSSTIDLHLTIKHFLLQVHPRMSFESKCWHCRSLLQTLPDNRSCLEANIPKHLCTCEPHTQVPKSDIMQNLAKLVVYRINKYLDRNSYERHCYHLEFAKLLRAERRQHFDDDGHEVSPSDGVYSYLLMFTTNPKGLFRSTVLSNEEANVVKVRKEFVERLNSHLNESHCIESFPDKKFCICKPET